MFITMTLNVLLYNFKKKNIYLYPKVLTYNSYLNYSNK